MRASAERGVFVGLVIVGSLLVPVSTRPGAGPEAEPTFTKDVLPILQRSCQQCHRPGAMAPMSLLSYQEVRPWVRSIRTKVSKREMPPWHIDRSIGEYLEDPSLSDEEIANDRQVGRQRCAAGTSRGCPSAEAVRGRRRVDLRGARPDCPHGQRVQDSCERSGLHAGRDRGPGHHRRPLREVGADHPGREARRPPLTRVRRRTRRRRHHRPRRSGWARTPATKSISSSTARATTPTSSRTARRR